MLSRSRSVARSLAYCLCCEFFFFFSLLPSLSVTGSPFSPFVLEKREREGRLLSDVAIAVAAVATAAAADQTSAR